MPFELWRKIKSLNDIERILSYGYEKNSFKFLFL